jgi:hypothetical protein
MSAERLYTLPLDMDMDNDFRFSMLFEEKVAFVKDNLELIQAFQAEAKQQDPNRYMRYYAHLDETFIYQLDFATNLLAKNDKFKCDLSNLMKLIYENRGLFNQVYHAAASTKK